MQYASHLGLTSWFAGIRSCQGNTRELVLISPICPVALSGKLCIRGLLLTFNIAKSPGFQDCLSSVFFCLATQTAGKLFSLQHLYLYFITNELSFGLVYPIPQKILASSPVETTQLFSRAAQMTPEVKSVHIILDHHSWNAAAILLFHT